MTDRDPIELLRLCHGLLDETDAILERHLAGRIEVSLKADATYVTAADQEVELHLRSRLADAFPGHGYVGEEYAAQDGQADARWFIDPIDGTANFARQVPVFATLLALERDGALVVGLVSAPGLGQRWWATAGGGAFTRAGGRERRIYVSGVARLDQAQLLFGTLRSIDAHGRLPGWLSLLRRSWRDRGFGDFWGHMLVAQGSAEAMLDESGVRAWDLAAPAIILAEAGGLMTNLHGRASWHGPEALSSNRLLHGELLAALAEDASAMGSVAPAE